MKDKKDVDEGSTKKSMLLWIGLAVVILAVVAISKGVFFNKPKETPRQITQKMIDSAQKDNATDEDRAEIRKYIKQNLLNKWSSESSSTSSDSTSSAKSVMSILSVEENGSSATATIEISSWTMKLPVQYKFTKEGNYWKGYKWMVSDLIGFSSSSTTDTEKKEATVKAGEKASINSGDWSLVVSQPIEYTSSNQYDKPDDGMRFVAVELQYFNDSASSDTANPTSLTLRDSEGHSFSYTYSATKEPEIKDGTTVTAKGTAKGFVTYQVPVTAKITSAVYSNSYVNLTITF